MGMDLKPRNEKRGAEWLGYNWSGWRFMEEFGDTHGVDVSEFDGSNDGALIKAATCRAMAKAIEDNEAEYNEAFGGTPEPMGYGDAPAREHARRWRESGGFRQY